MTIDILCIIITTVSVCFTVFTFVYDHKIRKENKILMKCIEVSNIAMSMGNKLIEDLRKKEEVKK